MRVVPAGFVRSDDGTLVRQGFEAELPDWRNAVAGAEAEEEAVAASTTEGREGGRGATARRRLRSGGFAFVRRYRHGGLLRNLLRDVYWQRPPRPLRELMVTEAARACGIAAPEVLAAWETPLAETGMARRLYRGALVTRAIEGRRSLAATLRDAASRAERDAWIDTAATAVERLHAAGIEHPDLNVTNILVGADPSEPAALIDFDRAALRRRPVGWLGRLRAHRRLARSIAKLGIEDLDRATVRRKLRSRPRDASDAPRVVCTVPDWSVDDVAQVARTNFRAEVLKSSRRRTVLRLPKAGPRGEAVVVKRVVVPRGLRRLEAWLIGTPAYRQLRAAVLLRAAGVDAPEPLAAIDAPGERGSLTSSFVCAAIEDAPDLRRHAAGLPPPERLTLARSLGAVVARLHAAGLYIADLRDRNLLVRRDESGRDHIHPIDFDRVRWMEDGLPRRRRIANLVHLERTIGWYAQPREKVALLGAYSRAFAAFAQPEQRSEPARRGPGRERLAELAADVESARRRKDARVARRRWRAGIKPDERVEVSCILICGNEIRHIERCLQSVSWCDEVVVVDSQSTDGTVDVCRRYADRLIVRPWPGQRAQKEFALGQATKPWVLNLDADEIVSPRLRAEIEAVLAHDGRGFDGFNMPRLVYYLGRWWWSGGWYPGARLRLFRRDRAHWAGTDPHDRAVVRGRLGRLKAPIWHLTYDDVADHVETIDLFTGISAAGAEGGARARGWGGLVLRPLARFLRFYVLKGGWRMGREGLFIAISAAVYVHLKYAKIEEAERERRASA